MANPNPTAMAPAIPTTHLRCPPSLVPAPWNGTRDVLGVVSTPVPAAAPVPEGKGADALPAPRTEDTTGIGYGAVAVGGSEVGGTKTNDDGEDDDGIGTADTMVLREVRVSVTLAATTVFVCVIVDVEYRVVVGSSLDAAGSRAASERMGVVRSNVNWRERSRMLPGTAAIRCCYGLPAG